MKSADQAIAAQWGRWERMFSQAQGFSESGNPHDALARMRMLQRELDLVASGSPEERSTVAALRERARLAVERYTAANQAWHSELEQRFNVHVEHERALLQRPLRSV